MGADAPDQAPTNGSGVGWIAATNPGGEALPRAKPTRKRLRWDALPGIHPACKSSADDRAKALTGSWRTAPLFMRQPALALCDVSTHPMAACEAQIERQFPTVKHCCSSLGLAPHNDVSGGRVLRSRTLNVVRRATQAFRQAAQSVAR